MTGFFPLFKCIYFNKISISGDGILPPSNQNPSEPKNAQQKESSKLTKKKKNNIVQPKPKPPCILGDNMMPLIYTILTTALKSHELKYLDLRGQHLGKINLISIIDMLPPCVDSFYFDGFLPKSLDEFTEVINAIISHPTIKNSSWPKTDAKYLLEKVDQNNFADVNATLSKIKTKFVAAISQTKFFNLNSYAQNVESLLNTLSRFSMNSSTMISPSIGFNSRVVSFGQSSSSDFTSLSSVKKSSSGLHMKQISIFTAYDETTSNLLRECNELDGKDPVEVLNDNLESNFSIGTLYKNLGNLPKFP